MNPSLDWFIDAADLLGQGDPGPTPFLVKDLIVDKALVACVGKWKTTKSYGLLDVCVSVATGEPAFGALEIPKPGPVLYICEESGQAALWRRLDALCRGRAIDPERLRGRLRLVTNRGVKLDGRHWQEELLGYACVYPARLIVFDPLARMKAATCDESAQKEMAGVIEFMRELRDTADAAVAFVHHTGHQGDHMRGSSDLESVWETRLAWKREGKSSLVTIESEHREAEAAPPIKYRIVWDGEHRTMRFNLEGAEEQDRLEEDVRAYCATHPDASANATADHIGKRRKDVLALVRTIKQEGGSGASGTTGNHPSASGAAGGSPEGSMRASGTTTADVVPQNGNHPQNEGWPTDERIPLLDGLPELLDGHVYEEAPLPSWTREGTGA